MCFYVLCNQSSRKHSESTILVEPLMAVTVSDAVTGVYWAVSVPAKVTVLTCICGLQL